jgi:hypothetical protein
MKSFESGFTTIEVLTFLVGRPWDERAAGFLCALRPSMVRVVPRDEQKCDARLWRVTVTLDPAGLVRRIEQEVEVGLAKGWANGHDARCWIDAGGPAPLVPALESYLRTLERGIEECQGDGGCRARKFLQGRPAPEEACTGHLVHSEFTPCPVHDR